MNLNFVKVNPSGNTTVFILDHVPRDLYPELGSWLMMDNCLAAEQIGFIEPPTEPGAIARLQMMVGEFCGNAARGFAAWLVDRQFPGIVCHREGSHEFIVTFEVSGHNEVLNALVSISDSHSRQANVELSMPLPQWIEQRHDSMGLPFSLVAFEGIVHAVVWNHLPSENHFHQMKDEIQRYLGSVECLGVMYFEEEKNFMTPIVYTHKIGSMVWESSCGSGTVAVASALSERYGQSIDSLCLKQPGGVLDVSTKMDKSVKEVKIRGDVNIIAEGLVYL